jgi:hypothetical protein
MRVNDIRWELPAVHSRRDGSRRDNTNISAGHLITNSFLSYNTSCTSVRFFKHLVAVLLREGYHGKVLVLETDRR